jgi:hypothetical protein
VHTPYVRNRRRPLTGLIIAFAFAAAWPAAAGAHGPVAPIATSYLARVTATPPGIEAKVIDGDQRMWLRVDPALTVVLLDYRGAPYLRFSRGGVEVNHNSSMYYLNHTPAEVPPANLGASTPPSWARVSSGHDYGWHDGRLHALATVARPTGASSLGNWSVPLLVDGSLRSIHGGLWHADSPSIVWFWPIVVILACVLAGWRLRITSADLMLARGLAVVALAASAVSAAGRELHGRPSVSASQLIILAAVAAFVGWASYRLVIRRHTYFYFFLVAVVAVWSGVELLPVLLDGFVLAAVPAAVARVAAVLCLATGVSLLLMAFRLSETQREDSRTAAVAATLIVGLLVAAGCGSARGQHSASTRGLPASLLAESRPIGRGASFHPPVRGPVLGACRRSLGSRFGVHVELFAANRVMLVAAGIGVRPPLRFDAGRIAHARCYGDLVTLEPTGVVQVRPGSRLHVSDLFRSWGQPLSRRRLATFPARSVTVFVDGRLWHRDPGALPLAPHSEVVLEAGPFVPPHQSYTFPPGT